ncbi:MAG: alpha/beta fold hydrolase [Pirellulaceae bacterium]|nr:alpha/beta fold hydrolase [Pirellulaceae bacterium]
MRDDWRKRYPFASQYFEIPRSETTTDWVRMHFVQQGQGEQTVLCVHGNPTWSFTFREVLNQVSDQARVIAVDHIGCGLSHKPQKYNYCLQQHIGNLARFIEELDLRRITLLVHDWGGAIGIGAALKVPSRIERLVLLNTGIFPPPYVPWRIAVCRTPWLGEFAMRKLNVFARAALTMTLNRLPRLAPDVAAGLIAPYQDWDSRIAVARFVQDIPRHKNQATWQVLSRIEESVSMFASCPTRIIWGVRDWCFRLECLERLQSLFPQAKVHRLEDVGHYVMEEAPAEVIAQLRECLSE